MRGNWPPAPESREELAALLRRYLQEDGLGDGGGPVGALLELYAGLLSGTLQRISRLPEKHRIAFLNLQQQNRRLAISARAVAVFEIAEGYEQPVRLPQGTLVDAKPEDGSPVLFRTRRAFTAVPSRLTDLAWCHRERDAVRFVEPGEPFVAWGEDAIVRGRHLAEWVFPEVFSSVNGNQRVELAVRISLDGVPVAAAVLADRTRCLWSLAGPSGEVLAELEQAGPDVLLLAADLPCQAPQARLRLELLDPELTGLTFHSIAATVRGDGILPESVVAEGRELEPAAFYPFGNPMFAGGMKQETHQSQGKRLEIKRFSVFCPFCGVCRKSLVFIGSHLILRW